MADTTPTIGWICTDHRLSVMAEAMLDEAYKEPSMKLGHTNVYRLGRIGPLNVVMNYLPEPPSAADTAHMAQNMATSFSGIRAILITTFGSRVPSNSINYGDLVISPVTNPDDSDAESSSKSTLNIVQHAAYVLQREVGADGHWLSDNLSHSISNFPDLPQFVQQSGSDLHDYPQLHYGNMGSAGHNLQNKQLRDRWAEVKNIIGVDVVAAGLSSLQIPTVVILGISVCVNSSESDVWKWHAAVNAASYGKELIQVMTNNLLNSSIPDLEGTEKIVPPHMVPSLPPFQSHQYPSHGNAVLLVIPTENESKRRLLQEAFRERTRNDVTVHTITISSASGVGEQPYNEAGSIGAHNRISNTLLGLDAAEYQDTFKEKRIGTVIVASIESFIQTDDVDRPTDYGLVVIHNATTNQTTASMSYGVTVPPVYVNRARRFGFDGDPNRGRVTVGQILAAHVPGLDKADWQLVLAGRSRYELLNDAVRQAPIPW